MPHGKPDRITALTYLLDLIPHSVPPHILTPELHAALRKLPKKEWQLVADVAITTRGELANNGFSPELLRQLEAVLAHLGLRLGEQLSLEELEAIHKATPGSRAGRLRSMRHLTPAEFHHELSAGRPRFTHTLVTDSLVISDCIIHDDFSLDEVFVMGDFIVNNVQVRGTLHMGRIVAWGDIRYNNFNAAAYA